MTLFLELADELDALRMSATGIDLAANFRWASDEEPTASTVAIDRDDFRSFITNWRQFVMRDEPTHLPTILALCSDHLAHPKLREIAGQVRARVDAVNRNDWLDRPRATFTAGGHGYSPWEVADLVMHGSMLHKRDRAKRTVLQEVDPWMRTAIEHIFREYVVDITVAADLTRQILLKAQEKGVISDAVIESSD